jgi:hypothetical protein
MERSLPISVSLSKGDIMMKNALLPLTVGLILGSAVWGVKATPLSTLAPATSQNQPIEKIGCSRSSSNDTCPYGYQPRGYGCQPCGWNKKYGSRYHAGDERYYEPRRYMDYDHGYYGPRKYPREYY